jgi:hypothetical protein
MKNTNNIISKKDLKIAQAKQVFHAYLPVLILFIFPHGFTTLLISLGFVFVSMSVYLKRIGKKMSFTYEYYLANSILTLILLGGYANGL